MASLNRHPDRRVQRTQQVLQQAFTELMLEKGFTATSIQDITARANVNRGTFYLHFADKYELLNSVMRAGFQQQLASRLPPTARWDPPSLHRLIWAVLDALEAKYRHRARPVPVLVEVEPFLEHSMHDELATVLLKWLKQAPTIPTSVPVETTARVVSWAIFGTALQWSREPATIPIDRMTQDIFLVITRGSGRFGGCGE